MTKKFFTITQNFVRSIITLVFMALGIFQDNLYYIVIGAIILGISEISFSAYNKKITKQTKGTEL
ncbi:hypothetical protein GCM10011351_31540 [Paraliobacillus quinghaiensis]|uniref:Uncharacterized protein n=1 Tax=Paraliobacillus quinghaiensis TaxID=470815 RepID=A0A917WZK4_9BACI|nr:hypothetical protein GCM10011351_31540 [Paraliobacillus quinghaiensis]